LASSMTFITGDYSKFSPTLKQELLQQQNP
jgi:hypothetical protein